jgi:Cu(I)/Ag(I) efflux system membrane fusion protein
MYANVSIAADLAVAEEISAPDSAILDDGQHQTVLVDRGEGRFEPRAVKIGSRADGYVAILGGLKVGEKVVVKANFLIDAESNLQAALRAFMAKSPEPDAAQVEAQP